MKTSPSSRLRPSSLVTATGLLLLAAAPLHAGSKDYKPVAPPESPLDDRWRFSMAVPAWVAGVEGDTGINGYIAHVDVDALDVLRRVDMTASLRVEASKGRFGITGDFLYLSLSDGIGSNTVVKKLDVQLDEIIGDLGLRWRLLEGPRGFLDVTAGVRYVNIYQQAVTQPNDERIGAIASRIAATGTALRLVLARELVALSGRDATLPIAPLNADQARKLEASILRIRGNAAEREQKIAKLLHNALDARAARTDDWFDPYIGLRGRLNLGRPWYLSAKGDVGGFGVGSDFTWQAEGALGCQLTRSIYSELGYRALGVDYDKDGYTNNTITHGVQLTTGIAF